MIIVLARLQSLPLPPSSSSFSSSLPSGSVPCSFIRDYSAFQRVFLVYPKYSLNTLPRILILHEWLYGIRILRCTEHFNKNLWNKIISKHLRFCCYLRRRVSRISQGKLVFSHKRLRHQRIQGSIRYLLLQVLTFFSLFLCISTPPFFFI